MASTTNNNNSIKGGYAGVKGCLGEEGLLAYFDTHAKDDSVHWGSRKNLISDEAMAQGEHETVAFASFSEVFRAVSDGTVEFGIVPIENTIMGLFTEVQNLLMRNDLHVVGEKVMFHNLVLAAKPGTARKDVATVYSHAKITNSCQIYLKKLRKTNNRPIQTVAVASTTDACRTVLDSDSKDCAAICSEAAAEKYGLSVLSQKVADDANFASRFVVIHKKRMPPILQDVFQNPTTKWCAAVAVDLTNEPMSLLKCISCVSFRGCNINRISTFPLKKKNRSNWDNWVYMDFAVDNIAHANSIFKSLEEFCVEVKELGLYPNDSEETRMFENEHSNMWKVKSESSGPVFSTTNEGADKELKRMSSKGYINVEFH